MRSRKIIDSQIVNVAFFGGYIIQIKTERSPRYWHVPEEELTYRVLDSSWPNVYKRLEDAQIRLEEILYR